MVQLRKCNGVEVPPGYDPVLDAKAKTSRSAMRNERKKEKKQQVFSIIIVIVFRIP